MPRARLSRRAEQHELREGMRGRGMSHRQIAAEFARRYKYRSRAAWRHAHGWSLTEAAEQINSYAIEAGLGHGLTTVAMTASHLCEMEGWPGEDDGGAPSGRRPTPYLLSLLAAVYGCTPADLVDTADCEHLRVADRIVLDQAVSGARSGTGDGYASTVMPAMLDDVRQASPVAECQTGTGRRELVGLAAAAILSAATSSLARSHGWGEGGDSPGLGPGEINARRAVTVPALHDLVGKAKADYQACRYQALGASLPRLLADAESVSQAARGDEKQRAYALLAAAYHVAASMLLKSGDHDLAWVMADRSNRAAETSEDMLAAGSSARIVTHVLLATGRGREAVSLATTAASHLSGRIIRSGPTSLSVYGALLLRGAVAAAAVENRSAALELLDEAGEATKRLGADGNYYWTAFGPVNLQLHRVHVATRLGDAGTALAYAAAISPDRIKTPERKASFWIDVAQARIQRRQADQALAALLAAEECAPEEARTRPVVRELITDLRSLPGVPSAVAGFAARIGWEAS